VLCDHLSSLRLVPWEAIHHLPSEEKAVFLLRQNGELTYEQIAQRDNRSVEVVKEQMRGALRKLRPVVH
jgi:RNA polymerase sigma-70 factor, ECF subfamily